MPKPEELTSTLKRQLAMVTTSEGTLEVDKLLLAVNESYLDHVRDLRRMSRANGLMGQELQEMLEIVQRASDERAEKIKALEEAQLRVAAQEAEVRHAALHDPLTNLPNRALVADRLNQAASEAQRDAKAFAVHCLDLDQFKSVNDTFGHHVGDELIKAVAGRLETVCRQADTIGRLGGDEFVIIQRSAASETAAGLAERIVQALGRPFTLSVGDVAVGCSVGVTIISDFTIPPLDALRQADLALYRAKALGRGQYAMFESELDLAVRRKRALQADLRLAMVNGELDLAFQPQVDRSGKIIGVEALARWNHPVRGAVSPTTFIAAAEECGFIVELGYFTLRRAFEESRRWPHLRTAINISARQLRMKDFGTRLAALVAEAGVSPSQFELEITEGVLMGDDAATHELLQQIREMGFCLSLDDFGTGYSSLSYLQRYPVDKIKIDRSFVTPMAVDEAANAMVRAIVMLAKALKLEVVAEGVEDMSQFEAAVTAGCDEIQGYFIGRPMPAEQMQLYCRQTVNLNDNLLSMVS